MPISKKRLAEIEAIPEEEIDYSDIPELGPDFFENARLVLPPRSMNKKTVTLRLDSDVLDPGRVSSMNTMQPGCLSTSFPATMGMEMDFGILDRRNC